ncbi:SRR1-like protein isoform X1 [Atheta coriaria]|uniref:SRR1-like protein isoform X1 n=1 Tax=Dalotia coriaria TaxID=877792 RepID=UPI0031F42FE4
MRPSDLVLISCKPVKSPMSDEEFKKITYKRKSKPQQPSITQQLADISLNIDDFDKNKAIRRVLEAKDDILASDYYSNVQASVREALSLLQHKNLETQTEKSKQIQIKELICFGIGYVSDSMISRYQLALILILKEVYNIAKVKICDPILTSNDFLVLEHFEIEIIKENIEAKYIAHDYTLFYLPHCPKQLSNNLLWANWSKNSLENCIIISNSFQSLIENNTKQNLIDNAQFVYKISPFVQEIAIFNTFKYYEIFNDAAMHVFPNLSLIAEDFWFDVKEPKYLSDIEYIEA